MTVLIQSTGGGASIFGACLPWTYDPDCCDLPDEATQEMIDRWTSVSTDILWAASGRRYGECEVTIRPCLRRCGGGVSWEPHKGSDGSWYNVNVCGCPDDPCSCTSLCEVVLPGPVSSIVEVSVDGVVGDEGAYRLDLVGTQWRLVHTDGGCWPTCQDLTAGCDEVGSFCVSYLLGIPLSDLAIAANSELACELVKSCIPGCPCRLPKNVQAVTRRGVSITFESSKGWLHTLPMVSAFLLATNPRGLVSASSVWSPDVPSMRITSG